MLVNLNKNTWLYDWMRDKWHDDLYEIIASDPQNTPRPNTIKKQLANLLNQKGYKAKATSNGNIIINMRDDEYTFLALKYSGE